MKYVVSAMAMILSAMPAVAQEARTARVLPADSEVMLWVSDTVTTRGQDYQLGDTFRLTVADDVLVDGQVVIPRGSRAVGKITWLTNRGAFGKSGKMEIALQYVDVRGQRLPLTGTYRQEGEGNTAGTIGAIAAAGLVGGSLVTGHSAVIQQGRAMVARTAEPFVVRYLPGTSQGLAARRPQTGARLAGGWALENAAPGQRWGLVEVKAD